MMIRQLTFSALAFATMFSYVSADEIRILPEDEADRDLSLLEFREQMKAAVQQKDGEEFLKLVADDVAVSTKKTGSLRSFKKAWSPESKDSELWTTMSHILSMGGGFLRSERGVKFCAPYTFVNFPAHLDVYGHGIIVKDNVAFKAKPSQAAPTLLNLSYHVVKLADWRSVADQGNSNVRWLKVKTLDGKEGYVPKESIRSPADYSACFLHRSSTGWKLISLTSND